MTQRKDFCELAGLELLGFFKNLKVSFPPKLGETFQSQGITGRDFLTKTKEELESLGIMRTILTNMLSKIESNVEKAPKITREEFDALEPTALIEYLQSQGTPISKEMEQIFEDNWVTGNTIITYSNEDLTAMRIEVDLIHRVKMEVPPG